MVQPVGDSDGKWKAITGFIEGLAGSQVEVIDELYKSETATNFNNKSIAWLLKNYNRIYDDPDMALDIYTRQCSIGVTAKQLATMAATIANGGKNPVTKQQVFKPELSPKIASMMATVGFYEHTGDWLFTTGLPAKTGVGGGIVAESRKAIENLIAILKEAGYGLEDVVRVGVWLDDPRDFWSFNGVYAEYFKGNAPARACVESALARPAFTVEIGVVAVA